MNNVSIIIPVYNQAFPLSLTLMGIRNQNPPFHETPVLVIDDGSTEPIESIVESYKSELIIRYIRIPRSGRAAARNHGMEQLGDGLAIFCDADRIPRPGFVQAYSNSYNNNRDVITIGQVREMYVPDPQQNRTKIVENYLSLKNDRNPHYFRLISHLFGNQGEIQSPVPWIATLSGNMSVPVRLYKELGGFDEQFKEWGFEHFEFGYRAFTQGTPFRYEHEAVNVHIAHPRSSSYKALLQASHSYFFAKHPHQVVGKLLDFMLGQCSLYELIMTANSKDAALQLDCAIEQLQSLYVKITNL